MQNDTPQLPLFAIAPDGVIQDLPQIAPITKKLVKDLTGKVFARLTVLGYVGLNVHGHATWLCRCDCGQHRVVARGGLVTGTSRSCGCLQRDRATEEKLTHGMSDTREYACWRAIITRCENQNLPQYKDYGGKGIAVCERWRHSFENFRADMGPRPTLEHSIDRIDNDGPYSPDNCRWATFTEQMNNTRRNVYLEFQGERLTIIQWARKLHIHYSALYYRIRAGWGVERALTTPAKRYD